MAADTRYASMRSELEQERDALREQLVELGFDGGGTGLDYDQNFADSSQVTAERGESEALATKLQETLVEVEHALMKLEAGNYGACEGCGQDIAEPRLEAMPAARHCIDCASKR